MSAGPAGLTMALRLAAIGLLLVAGCSPERSSRMVLRLHTGEDGRWDRPFLVDELRQAMAEWDRRSNPCTGLELELEVVHGPGRVDEDGVSAVLFEDRAWCPPGARKKHECYGSQVAAITTRFDSSDRSAAMPEADILINALDHDWQTAAGDRTELTHRRRRILLHEIGHVLGLADVCHAPSAVGRRTGACKPAPLERSIMFADERTTTQPVLSASDRQFVCDTYPR